MDRYIISIIQSLESSSLLVKLHQEFQLVRNCHITDTDQRQHHTWKIQTVRHWYTLETSGEPERNV